jgi:hypothetical protein
VAAAVASVVRYCFLTVEQGYLTPCTIRLLTGYKGASFRIHVYWYNLRRIIHDR